MGFFSDIGSFIMTPLYYAISAIMLGWHKVFSDRSWTPRAGSAGRCRSSG